MEESEKRKERLMAMRMEAAQAGADSNSSSSGLSSSCLSNPLIETSSPAPYSAPRFDFYTDPMSAFSGSRRNNNTPHVLQGHNNAPQRPVYQGMTPPSSVYHGPGADSPGQRIFQAPTTHFNRSPSPSFGHQQGNPTSTWGGSRDGNFSNPGNPPYVSHGQGNPPYVSHDQGNPPYVSHGQENPPYGSYGQGNPPYVSHGQGNPPYVSHGQENPPYGSYGQGNRPYGSYGQGNRSYGSYGQGRGQRFNSGRSRGSPGNSQSPRSGFGGRRGSGSHEAASAEQRPYLYYRKEMVEDPWEMLTPIVWKDTQAHDSDRSWLPKSISMKKAKVSGEGSQSSISQQSLAEYLAASFKDSTDEAVDDERGS